MRGWHFVGNTLYDGRPIPRDGELLRFDGDPIPCKQGLHWSKHPFDALRYAPGNTLCLVEGGGNAVPHGSPVDKYAGTERTIIVRMAATPLLRYFARQQALSVVHLWDAPQVVLDFLMGDDAAHAAHVAAAAAYTTNAAARAACTAARAAYTTDAGAAAHAAADAHGTYIAVSAARAAAVYTTDAAAYAAPDAPGTYIAAAAAARAAARSDFAALVYDAFADWI